MSGGTVTDVTLDAYETGTTYTFSADATGTITGTTWVRPNTLEENHEEYWEEAI